MPPVQPSSVKIRPTPWLQQISQDRTYDGVDHRLRHKHDEDIAGGDSDRVVDKDFLAPFVNRAASSY